MVCYSPMKVYPSSEVNPETGKRGVTFAGNKSHIEGMLYTLPCGSCIGCRLDRANAWAIRCTHEARMHAHYEGGNGSVFLTLTIAPNKMLAHCSVLKVSLQRFLKRLRKAVGVPIRYMDCGEYGDKRGRPHYHMILFGWSFPDRVMHKRTEQGHYLFTSEVLDKAWSFGKCFIGDVSYQSARYVASYITKKWKGDGADAHYTRPSSVDGEFYRVEPEFASMSLKHGLGERWFDKFEGDVFPSDECIIDGISRKPPRYYDKLFVAKHGEEAFEPIKRKRRRDAVKARSANSPDRLAVREECATIKFEKLERRVD